MSRLASLPLDTHGNEHVGALTIELLQLLVRSITTTEEHSQVLTADEAEKILAAMPAALRQALEDSVLQLEMTKTSDDVLHKLVDWSEPCMHYFAWDSLAGAVARGPATQLTVEQLTAAFPRERRRTLLVPCFPSLMRMSCTSRRIWSFARDDGRLAH